MISTASAMYFMIVFETFLRTFLSFYVSVLHDQVEAHMLHNTDALAPTPLACVLISGPLVEPGPGWGGHSLGHSRFRIWLIIIGPENGVEMSALARVNTTLQGPEARATG